MGRLSALLEKPLTVSRVQGRETREIAFFRQQDWVCFQSCLLLLHSDEELGW